MAIYIRQLRNGRLYAGFNLWSQGETQAYDFVDRTIAARWIATVNMKDIEIISCDPADPIVFPEEPRASADWRLR